MILDSNNIVFEGYSLKYNTIGILDNIDSSLFINLGITIKKAYINILLTNFVMENNKILDTDLLYLSDS